MKMTTKKIVKSEKNKEILIVTFISSYTLL